MTKNLPLLPGFYVELDRIKTIFLNNWRTTLVYFLYLTFPAYVFHNCLKSFDASPNGGVLGVLRKTG